jgi:hypothetical protein
MDNASVPEAKPDKISAEDLGRIENLSLKQENAALKIANLRLLAGSLEKEMAALQVELRAKYQLGEGDSIDPQTMAIKRK